MVIPASLEIIEPNLARTTKIAFIYIYIYIIWQYKLIYIKLPRSAGENRLTGLRELGTDHTLLHVA